MADRGDTHYHVPSLNTWFLFSSAFLLVVAVWMVIDDYQAQWKNHQREFRDLELERTEAQLASEEAVAVLEAEAAAQAELDAALASLDAQSTKRDELEAEIFQLEGDRFNAIEAAKAAKQAYNWERYLIEEERLHTSPDYMAEELAEFEQAMIDTAGEQELAEIALAEKQAELKGMMEDVAAAEARFKLAGRSIDLVRKKKQSLAPDALDEQIANIIRDDIPGLDFIGPNIKVNKVVLEDLTFELNFTKKKRIDMCMTCHMAADREGFGEDVPQPYRSHPRLDLFLTAKSPHPYTEVGCTICHRGAGEALDFGRVDHNLDFPFEADTPLANTVGAEWDLLGSAADAGELASALTDAIYAVEDEIEENGESDALLSRLNELNTVAQFSKDELFGAVERRRWRIAQEAKVEDWHDEYHWHKKHYWDYPMLSSEKAEASCVQCHQTSMELIAEDAPQVTKGYRLFERYGCYACHKVEWFPTKRRPGPSLTNIQAKTNTDWIASWIADPRGFRPTTWMPQVFHLENWDADAVVAKANYGEGEDILGQQWNDSAVAAITAYVAEMAPKQELAPIPVEGNPERGREAFRLSGCLACHNMAGYFGEEAPPTNDIAYDKNEYNTHGPNLRGVATKLNADWLYWWIKNPAAMWNETRMPNLRLSDQDAADITAYIMEDPDEVFLQTPEGWQVEEVPYDMAALQEQARTYYSRVSRATVQARLDGQDPEFRWDQPDELLVAVGEKMVGQYGCFSCHEIATWENANPIGVELTNWASKTVDKLDWGLLANLEQDEQGWDQAARTEYKSYRENWIRHKLHEPRSFDRGKEKSPTERLKMPWFDFEDDEVEAIITFVVGMVDDEVQRAKMVPTADQASADVGLRAIRQHNCAACHVMEAGTVTYRDEDGVERTVSAEMLSMDAAYDAWMHPVPPQDSLHDLLTYIDDYSYAIDEEVDEVGIRLLAPEPEVGMTGENVFIPTEDLIAVTPSWGGDFVKAATNYYYFGVEKYDPEAGEDEEPFYNVWGSDDPDAWALVEDNDGESRDYSAEPYDKVRWTFAPPVLWGEGAKLQKPWFYAFLNDPMPLREQLRVKMPTFNYRPGQAGAITDYFAYQAVLEWPAEFARRLRLSQDMTLAEMSVESGISEKALMGIESGSKPDTEAKLSDLIAYATRVGFSMEAAVDPSHERQIRRSPTYLARMTAAHADYLSSADQLAREGPQCFQCHFDAGTAPNADPIAWAPDLARARERLREDWTYRWLEDPNKIYPGTAMPANFVSDPPQYQAIFEGSNAEQIGAIVDWLFNYDRLPPRN